MKSSAENICAPIPRTVAKATILVVDDTPDNLTLMSSLLNADYQVKIANGGEKALKIATRSHPA